MLRTRLCDVLGIDVPIILAAMEGAASSAEFAAAASNQGALGSIGSLFRTNAAVKRDIDVVQQLTNRNYAVNHIPPTLDADAFRHTLAGAGRRDLVRARRSRRSGAAGPRRRRQGHDSGHHGRASDRSGRARRRRHHRPRRRGRRPRRQRQHRGAGPAGGRRGVAIPVVAAGGIFDGRGIAAAFMLGAVGVNIGTRFLASREAPIDDAWKAAIAAAESEDAVKVDVLNDIQPLPGSGGYGTVLRSLHTPFMDEWSRKRDQASRQREQLWAEIQARGRAGRRHEVLLTAADLGRHQDHPAAGRDIAAVDRGSFRALVTCVAFGLRRLRQ